MRHIVTSRRRAEEFAAAVDRRDATSPEHVDAEFVALVEQLRDLETPTLRADFASDVRSRLMDEAATVLSKHTAPATTRHDAAVVTFPASPRRRVATAAAAAAIVVGSMAGVAAASQQSLPGETLYPIKRGIEHLEVAVAWSDHARGSEYLDQASSRLDEISDLTVAHGDDPTTPGLVRDTLEAFSAEAGDGADALLQSYDASSDPSNIRELRTFADTSARRLDALSGSLPSTADDALAQAAQVLQQLDQRAQQLCPDCSTLPTLSLSGALMSLTDSLEPGGISTSPGATTPAQGGGDEPGTQGQGPTGADGPTGSGVINLPTLAAPPTPVDQQPGNDPGSSPGLPGLTGLNPTQAGPNPTGSQPSGGGGVTVKLPGGGGVTVGTQVPSVPVPPVTIDLDDPLGSVPQVIDDVTGGLGLGGP